jgi:hypothetical protein
LSGHRFALELSFFNDKFWQVDQKIAQNILENAIKQGLEVQGYNQLMQVKLRPLRKLSIEKDVK